MVRPISSCTRIPFCIENVSLQTVRVRWVVRLSLVVPSDCRPTVLQVAHEGPFSGHFSHRKTQMKISEDFFLPGMRADIHDYCRSCDKCQRMSAKGRVRPVLLQPLPIVTEPFARVAIDLVGPLFPPSSEGHRYILTLVDFSTGFPEAVPLTNIDTISVSEALLSIFARVGIPKEVLSDRGTQFTSELMAELHKLLGVIPVFTTPFSSQWKWPCRETPWDAEVCTPEAVCRQTTRLAQVFDPSCVCSEGDPQRPNWFLTF